MGTEDLAWREWPQTKKSKHVITLWEFEAEAAKRREKTPKVAELRGLELHVDGLA